MTSFSDGSQGVRVNFQLALNCLSPKPLRHQNRSQGISTSGASVFHLVVAE